MGMVYASKTERERCKGLVSGSIPKSKFAEDSTIRIIELLDMRKLPKSKEVYAEYMEVGAGPPSSELSMPFVSSINFKHIKTSDIQIPHIYRPIDFDNARKFFIDNNETSFINIRSIWIEILNEMEGNKKLYFIFK